MPRYCQGHPLLPAGEPGSDDEIVRDDRRPGSAQEAVTPECAASTFRGQD
jgi:hypothetical protein